MTVLSQLSHAEIPPGTKTLKFVDPLSLEVKGMALGGAGGVTDRAYTIHTTNIMSQWQYLLPRCLSFYVGNVFGLDSMRVCFRQVGVVGKTKA